MITADQLVVHALGDYVLQSDWMANEKTKKSFAALAHAASYTLGFLFLTFSWKALLVIGVTHFLIDRFRLARYVCWLKNFLAPRHVPMCYPEGKACPPGAACSKCGCGTRYYRWSECSVTGYHKDKPLWMSVWLMIIADNFMHVVINAFALHYL